MVIRIRTRDGQNKDRDLGPGVGRRHWWAEAREEFDEKLARPQRHEPMVLGKR